MERLVFDLLSFLLEQKRMPGSHIPILPPEQLIDARPDYLLILPWNIADEVKEQNAELAKSGTTFVTAVPELRLL